MIRLLLAVLLTPLAPHLAYLIPVMAGGVFWLIAFWRNPRFAVSEKSKTLGESL